MVSASLYRVFFRVSAQDGSVWLVADAPQLSKITELPSSTPPPNNNADCDQQTLTPDGTFTQQVVCTFQSPLGRVTTNGQIFTGANSLARLQGPNPYSFFLPTPDPTLGAVSLQSPGTGNYLGIYRHLTKASLQKQIDDLGDYYRVASSPDAVLADPQTGQPLQIATTSIAFSASGQWMVADLPQRGLVRVNMADLSLQLFAKPLEPSWYIGLATPPLAISDDGRFVAANTDIFGDDNLSMYDLSTCTDQVHAETGHEQYCAGKNIWNGQALDSQPFGNGLLSTQPDLQQPTHLRFVNNDNLSFNARYAVQSNTNFKAAEFVTTAAGEAQHKLGLLGLGDSYISGEGTFNYRDGSDTNNNGCHISELSYPSLLGRENFDSSNSVACSGALTGNVIGYNPKGYIGQVKDNTPEIKRNKSNILAHFLPGYIYQQEFASTYLPQAMLLSVGGDDIDFTSIVKSCVANAGGGTCYDTYEDRAELVNEIDSTYPKLVATYNTLREQSGGAKLFVVGYPQIAQPGGDCGLNVHLNDQEVTFSNQLVAYLDGVVQKAATTAGVFYVDTQHAFDGHKLCEPGQKAMNGLTKGSDAGITIAGHTINFVAAESYHPTPFGYQLLAQTIAQKTHNLTAAMPLPTSFAVPGFDPSTAILQNVPQTGRPINWVTHQDDVSPDFMLQGDTQQIVVDGGKVQLQPGSQYQIVLHSTPILLDEGGVDAGGNIATAVQIPAETPAGYHTLHIYSTDMAGQSVDIQKIIYVATNDGTPAGSFSHTGTCVIVADSRQDVDGDGIDDACDPEITSVAATAKVQSVVSTTASLMVQSQTITPDNVESAKITSTPRKSVVLGDANSQSGIAKSATSPATVTLVQSAKLYKLTWLPVLAALTGLTITITMLSLVFHRSK